MSVRPAARTLSRGPYLLAVAYLGGVTGTLWDWREHFVGISNQAPHALIDLSGLLVVGVLAFTGWRSFSGTTRIAIYAVLVLLALLLFAPFILMLTAPHSAFMSVFMRRGMSRTAVLLQGPFVVLSGWAAWQWLERSRITLVRLAASLGVVVVAVASVWDLYWHQTHPMESGTGMNMMTIPPHELILAGFIIGLAGSVGLITLNPKPATTTAT